MEQPNFGKRISELRKAKGLTHEELAEQSKISVRTLQRIESGVVTQRAYTIRVIYAVLKVDSSFMKLHFEHVKDLFNLKKNTMKKVSILLVAVLATGFGLSTKERKFRWNRTGSSLINYVNRRFLILNQTGMLYRMNPSHQATEIGNMVFK